LEKIGTSFDSMFMDKESIKKLYSHENSKNEEGFDRISQQIVFADVDKLLELMTKLFSLIYCY
jgi:hypothetical protein